MATLTHEAPESERLAARENFNAVAKKYGAEIKAEEKKRGPFSKERDLVIEQKLGHGLALGYDKSGHNLWLAPGVESFYTTTYWNTNTELAVDQQYPGIVISRGAAKDTVVTEITPDHPVAKFVTLLKTYGWTGELVLAGERAGNFDVSRGAKVEMGEDGKLRVESKRGQSKLVFTNVDAEFQDAGWEQEKTQNLKILSSPGPK